MKTHSNTLLWGLFLICLGALFLLSSLDLVRLEDEIMVARVFFAGGLVLLAGHLFFHKQIWSLILGCLGIFIGFAVYVSETRMLPEVSIGIFLFLLAGVVFLCALRKGRRNWWAIIPGGFCLSIAGHIYMDEIWYRTDVWHSVLVFGTVGVVFGVIYLLKNEEYRLDWAKYPSLIGFIMAALLMFTADMRNAVSRFFFPLLLVGAGALLIVRSINKNTEKSGDMIEEKKEKIPEKKVDKPAPKKKETGKKA